MWGPLLYSPTTMKDGTSSSCFGSPSFPHQSPLTNFIDYSLLSGTEFMQTNNDEIIDISTHCSSNDHPSAAESNALYSAEEKELQILLATNTTCNGSGDNNSGATNVNDCNSNSGSINNCAGPFGNTIKPLQRIIDINTDNLEKSPGILELCRRAQQGMHHEVSNLNNNDPIGNTGNSNRNSVNKSNYYHHSRSRTAEEFADQDLKMNCVNQPPVIISENEKICVILESSNVGLDSCSTSNNTNATNNKQQFTDL